jgi:hypothetical protein
MRLRYKVGLGVFGGLVMGAGMAQPVKGPATPVPAPTVTVTQTVTPGPLVTPSEPATDTGTGTSHHKSHVSTSVGGKHLRIHIG